MHPPTPTQLHSARELVSKHLARTPLIHSPGLGALTGADVWLKCECLAPIGSFKARGALAGVLQLPQAQRDQGLICASTGNHGAAMAWAARKIGASCAVVVPRDTPDIKLNNMRAAGADVIIDGADWGDSCKIARGIAAQRGLVYLEDGEDPWIMAGAASTAYEVLDELPDADAWLIPVGGGNFIAGCALAAREAGANVALFGVQSEAAQGVTESFRAGHIVERPTTSFAGGIATTGPVPMAFEVMKKTVADMLLVSERELKAGIGLLARHHAIIVEGAGAAGLAALLRYHGTFAGKRVVIMLSGRNLDPVTLAESLAMTA